MRSVTATPNTLDRADPLTEDADFLQVAMEAASDVLDTAGPVARTVTADDIEAAYHVSKTLFSAGGLALSESTVLLLKGGLAFLNLVTSPLELALPKADTTETGWAHWRSNADGQYELKHAESGEWNVLNGTAIDRSPATAEDLAATYSRTDAYSIGSATVVTRTEVVLAADGDFEQRGTRTASFNSSGMFNTYLPPVVSGWSSVDEAVPDANSEELTDQWTMLEDGMTLEITRTDGSIDKLLAYKLAKGLFVNGDSYTRSSVHTFVSQIGEFFSVGSHSDRTQWLTALKEAKEDVKRRNEDQHKKLTAEDLAREAIKQQLDPR